MLHPVDPGRRHAVLTRAARAFGLRALREDPTRFSSLLERTIVDNPGYFAPPGAPDALTTEARSLHGDRLEALIDEAIGLATELYPSHARDHALLAIAVHAERLMHVLRVDPWTSRLFTSMKGRSSSRV
jgi:hypothetical protein